MKIDKYLKSKPMWYLIEEATKKCDKKKKKKLNIKELLCGNLFTQL